MSDTYQITTHSTEESVYSCKLDVPPQKSSREKTWNFVNYRHSYFFLLSAVLLYLHTFLRPSMLGLQIVGNAVFSLQVACLLFFFVPSRVLLWYSILCSLLPFKTQKFSQSPVKRNFRRLIVCYVTRGQNIEALTRTIHALPNFKAIDSRLELHILTEAAAVPGLRHLRSIAHVHGTPITFTPMKAKFKARSLEWFRRTQKYSASDWVLHMDEESRIDEDAIRSTIDVICKDPVMQLAQGIILYNGHNYWKNGLMVYADVIRILDDFGRYQFQWNHCRRPIFGMHGSFMLINGEVENQITWETDNLTEDYWFALQAQKRGYKYGWIRAFVREQSPDNMWDFLQQHHRWITGIWTMGDGFANFLVTVWSWYCLEVLAGLICFVLGVKVTIPAWFWHVMCIENSFSVSANILSLALQDYDANVGAVGMFLHAAFLPFVLPFVNLLNSVAVVSALVRSAKRPFHVIKK